MKQPRFRRALIEGTLLAGAWLFATLFVASILPATLPPIDRQILDREQQRIRSWEDVERVHKEQMERLRLEASNPASLSVRQVATEVTRSLYIVPFILILLAGAQDLKWLGDRS